MDWKRLAVLAGAIVFVVCLGMAGCHTTTVSITAEDPNGPPELLVDILNCPAGQVEMTNTTRTDWFGQRHNTTTILVPPGTRIVVMPSSLPRSVWFPATQPASGPSTQPASSPAEE